MADNNRSTIKNASIVLTVLCVIFATVSTILYMNHQIGSIGYSAPVVIGIVVVILSCAVLQRLFYPLLAKSGIDFSFGCRVSHKTEAFANGIDADTPNALPQTDNSANVVV